MPDWKPPLSVRITGAVVCMLIIALFVFAIWRANA